MTVSLQGSPTGAAVIQAASGTYTLTMPAVTDTVATITNPTFSGVTSSAVFSEAAAAPAISAGVLALNVSADAVFNVSLNANITSITFSGIQAANKTSSFVLVFTYTGTAYTVVWPAAVRWPNGVAPTLSSTLNKRDVFTFFTFDNGTNWQAFISGQVL